MAFRLPNVGERTTTRPKSARQSRGRTKVFEAPSAAPLRRGRTRARDLQDSEDNRRDEQQRSASMVQLNHHRACVAHGRETASPN